MGDITRFVGFLRTKFKGHAGDGISWGNTHSLIFEGCQDTEGRGYVGVDYNALLAKIDEFAAEFTASAESPHHDK